MKSEDTGLSARPLLSDGNQSGLFGMNMGRGSDEVKIGILAPNGSSLKMIGQTPCLRMSWYVQAGLDRNAVEQTALRMAFGRIDCAVCENPKSAFDVSQSPLGNVCHCCWDGFEPKLPWVPVADLASYILKP